MAVYDSPLAGGTGSIVTCILLGVLFIPTIAIACISLGQVPAGPFKDPLRGPFIWLWSSFLAFILAILTNVLYFVLYEIIDYSRVTSKTGLYFSTFSVLFSYLTIFTVNLTLLFVTIALLHLVDGETRLHKFAKIASLVVTFIVSILAIAWWGVVIHNLSDSDFHMDPVASKCIHAAAFLSWILSLAIAGLSIMAFTKIKVRTDLGNLPQLLLGANFVWLVRTTYLAALMIKFYIGGYTDGEYLAKTIIDPIFDAWTTFIVLVLLFVIGKRRFGGLWPQAQQFASQQPITIGGTPIVGQAVYANQVPAGYVPYNMSQQPQYAYLQPVIPVRTYKYAQPKVIQPRDKGQGGECY